MSSRLRHRRVTDRSGSTVAGMPRPGSPKDRQPLKGDATPQTAGWPRTPQTCGTLHPRVQGWGQASASVEWGMGFGWPWRLPDLCPGPDSWAQDCPRSVAFLSGLSPKESGISLDLNFRRRAEEETVQKPTCNLTFQLKPSLSLTRGAREPTHTPRRGPAFGLDCPHRGSCDSGGRLLTSSLS